MSIRTMRQKMKTALALAVLLLLSLITRADAVVFPFVTPVFGLAVAPDGSLLAADAGAGIVEIRKGQFSLVASLPGVTDVAPIGRGDMFAITSTAFGGDGKLYRVSRGSTREIADLLAFEETVNPDGGAIDTDPFDVAVLNGGSALVADAAANALLVVDQKGSVDWVASFPNEVVPTDNAKKIFGCPGSAHPFCPAPAFIPAQPVPTSIAIGPDGSYYVGELKGFPAPKERSRIWKIRPGTRHAVCGSSPDCEIVGNGFTSIIDLAFAPDGRLLVVELDEESWLAMESGQGTGGSVNACNTSTAVCSQLATGLPIVTSAAIDGNSIYVVTKALIPGAAEVSVLP